MKKLLAALMLLMLCVAPAQAIDSTLTWDPPTTNEDGTPLTDLAGYNVYWGTETGNYDQSVDVGNVTQYLVTLPDDGRTYYYAVTAYDTSGNESVYSNEAQISTPDKNAPSNPTGCRFE